MVFGEKIAIGLVSGVSVALAGWGKSPGQAFSTTKFLSTILIGGIVGIVSEEFGISQDVVVNFFLNAGLTALIENSIKTVVRRVSAYLPKQTVAPASPAPAS